MKENSENPESKLVSENEQFEVRGEQCTPELLVQSYQGVQSTHHIGERKLKESYTVSGRYLASRTPLAGSGQIDNIIDEMRQLLDSKSYDSDETNRDELLQMWMSIEGCLTEDEHRQMFPSVLNRLFPDYKVPTGKCRDGTAQVGGY